MYKFLKRLFDILLSGFAIIMLSPLLVPVMIILKCTGEHDIFYGQDRIGYKNKHFKILKFATMLRNSPNMAGGLHTTHGDPRVLPFGRFLRKTKINELPQLFNIFLGDMSIVGRCLQGRRDIAFRMCEEGHGHRRCVCQDRLTLQGRIGDVVSEAHWAMD